MKPGVPWSVKGVEPEVRAAAKTAARRAGMTLGEWLNSVILDQNEHIIDSSQVQNDHFEERFLSSPPHEAGHARHETAAPRDEQPRAQASRRDDSALRLQDIAHQLAQLAQKERQSASLPQLDPSYRRLEEEEAFSQLLERIDDNERQTVEALTAVNDRLSMLSQQLVAQPRGPLFDRPEDVPGYSALESAIRNVVEHIEVSEKRTRDSLKSMQDRLSELAEQAAKQPRPEEFQRTAPVLASLEARVTELSNRMLRTESTMQAGISEAVRRETATLGERIEGVKASAAGIARSEIREIETRVLAMIRETQAAAASSQNAAADIGQLRGELGSFARRLDETRASSATERDLNLLRVAVEQLSTRVAQGPDMRPLAELDKRLGELGTRLDQIAATTGSTSQVREIENRIAELGRRLEDRMVLQADPRSVELLEQNIAAVNERVGRTEQQLRQIETMEHAIRQLYDSLEQSRDAASQAAEQTASRTMERLLSSRAPSGPSPELKALEEGLRAVRESAAGAERRSQETLAAVHETLSKIVEKIAELEARPSRVSELQQPAVGRVFHAEPAEAEPASDASHPASSSSGVSNDPDSALALTSDALTPLSTSDDFIAAARRAAQAAASRPSVLRAEFGGIAAPEDEDRGFSLFKRFRKQAKPEAPLPLAPLPGTPPSEEANTARRRRLLLAGMVLLVVVSAFAYNRLVDKSAAPPPSGAIETPVKEGEGATQAQPGLDQQSRSDLPGGALVVGSLSLPATPGQSAPLPAGIGTDALRNAAAGGNPGAQFIVATRYLEGEGVEADAAKAADWYGRSAATGFAPAQYRLATLLERGKGVPQDAAAALSWYEKAAAKGNVNSMHNAAVLIAGSAAGGADYARAFALFSAAAERGLRDSQFNLAILHERGLGTPVNKAEAYVWYRLAAQQGDAHAAERAGILEKSLPGGALPALAARVAGWTPRPADDAANAVTLTDAAWNSPDLAVLASDAAIPEAAAHDVVTEAQQLLIRLGFNVGTPDGKFGSRTASAIRLFQLQSGLEVTGRITPDVLDVMRAKAG